MSAATWTARLVVVALMTGSGLLGSPASAGEQPVGSVPVVETSPEAPADPTGPTPEPVPADPAPEPTVEPTPEPTVDPTPEQAPEQAPEPAPESAPESAPVLPEAAPAPATNAPETRRERARAAAVADPALPCVSGPTDPDRGRRPACDTPSGTFAGATYTPTIAVEGVAVPGGTLRITGTGWRPDQPGGVNLRLNDASALPSRPGLGTLEGSGVPNLLPDAGGEINGFIVLPPQADFDFIRTTYGTETYWLRFLSAEPAISLHVMIDLTPVVKVAPVVTSQPVSLKVIEGSAVRFRAAATGYPAPTVGWQVRRPAGEWTAIANATGSTYSAGTAKRGLDGNAYRAVFTNEVGQVVTEPATLQVDEAVEPLLEGGPPTISGTARVGEVLTADAGTWDPKPTSVSYTWLRDGDEISGASSRERRLTAADRGRKISVEVKVGRSGYTAVTSESDAVVPDAAKAPVVKPGVQGCITSPGSPDRGRRPICETNSILHGGKTYTASMSISGAAVQGGTVTVRGSGWRPGQLVYFRYNDLNQYGAGAGSVNRDGTLQGSGVKVSSAGSFTAQVGLPDKAAVVWAARHYATSRTWVRALSSGPALSLHRDVAFGAGLKAELAKEAATGAKEVATAKPTVPPTPPDAATGLTKANRGGVLATIDGDAVAARRLGNRDGAWVHAYDFVGASPRSLGWVEVDGQKARWPGAKPSVGDHSIVLQDAKGVLIGWDDVSNEEPVVAAPAPVAAPPPAAAAAIAKQVRTAPVADSSPPIAWLAGGAVALILLAGGISYAITRGRTTHA